MAKPRKSTNPRKRAAKHGARLIQDIENVATALDRDALHKLAHPFRDLCFDLTVPFREIVEI
jgi:hypothetical protein